MTHPDDRYWVFFGKWVATLSFLFVLCCAAIFVAVAITAERDYRTDTTPLAAPDSTPKKVKP